MTLFKRKEQKIEKIEDKQNIKAIKLGDKFNLEPGETASVEIPIPIEITDGHMLNIGKIVATYEDKYGNRYEVDANVDFKDISEKGVKKKIKGEVRIIYYGPFKKRILVILVPILIVGIIGTVAYMVTNNFVPIIIGLGLTIVLTIIIEIFHMKVNEKYKNIDKNKIDIVKEI